MVSWGTSFYKGSVIFLWCIAWAIIGGVIALTLGLGSLWVNLSQPDFWQALLRNPQHLWTVLTESLVGFLIGGVIAFIGQFASFFKVTVDGATGEVNKLQKELTQLKDEMTEKIADEPSRIAEATRDLQKKIEELRIQTAEEISKTRTILSKLSTRDEESTVPYNDNLEKIKTSLAKDIANRIVEEVNKNSSREREAAIRFLENLRLE